MNAFGAAPQNQDQIDELLEVFESSWSGHSAYLPEVVASLGGESCTEVIAELVRIDIDRRYTATLDVNLDQYVRQFPELLDCHSSLNAIAYEDFRARSSRGLSVPLERWQEFPSVKSEEWYQDLLRLGQARSARSSSASDKSSPQESTGEPKTLPQVGEQFGDFQLVGILGKGAFSRVYLATQPELASRFVALKVVRRSLREPAHLARLQHTGIVPLYSAHQINGFSVLCMPYFGAATLADWFGEEISEQASTGQGFVSTIANAQARLTVHSQGGDVQELDVHDNAQELRLWNASEQHPLEQLQALDTQKIRLWVATRIAAALAHAHQRGIVHGDIKPANILIRNDGEPALIDFNLAVPSDEMGTQVIGGTLPYMAPEQLESMLRREAHLSPASDLYATGMVLYEMLEGRLPFAVPTSAADSDLHFAIQQRSVASLEFEKASGGFCAIIAKCLHIDPAGRYQNASELLEDLEQEQANLPLKHASEDWRRSRLPKLLRRHPRFFSAAPISIVAALAILLVLGIAQTWRLRSLGQHAEKQLGEFSAAASRVVAQAWESEPHLSIDAAVELNSLIPKYFPGSEGVENAETWQRVPTELRLARQRELYDYCVTAASLALEQRASWPNTGNQIETIKELLAICHGLPKLADGSLLLNELQLSIDKPSGFVEPRFAPQQLGRQAVARPLETMLAIRFVLRSGDARTALNLLNVIEEPRNAKSLYWLTTAEAQLQLRQFESAGLSFSRAISVAASGDYTGAGLFARLASLKMQLRDWPAAESQYSRAIEVDDHVASHFANRALARERQNNLEGAIDDINQALVLAPHSNRLLFIRSRFLRQVGRKSEAHSDYQRALQNMPETVEDWTSRALARLPSKPDFALKDMQQAESIDPLSIVVQQNLAHIHSEYLHDNQAAISALSAILEFHPNHEMSRGGRCVLHAREGDSESAIADLTFLASARAPLMDATKYQMACAFALLSAENDSYVDSAAYYLLQAISSGYGRDILQTDEDLAAIRNSSQFQTIVEFTELSKTTSAKRP